MRRILNLAAGCPLFAALIVSAVVLSITGCVGAAVGIYKWDMSMKHPMLQAVLADEREDTDTPATAGDATPLDAAAATSGDAATATDAATSGDAEADLATDTDAATDEKTETATITSGGTAAPVAIPTRYRQIETRKARNECYRDLSQIAIETDYPYVKVDKSYFDDALFIGDSRVEGLALYSGLDNADFAYMEGLTTFAVMDEKIADNGTKTLTELLGSKKYGKIYIMLGINEAGYDTETFAGTYKSAIDRIRELQPGAKIFIMSCMHVTKEYSDKQNVINNDNLDDKNGAVAAYADGINIFYLDVNSALDDENGSLVKTYTWDDIHLQAQYYSLWENYLYERGLKDDAFSN